MGSDVVSLGTLIHARTSDAASLRAAKSASSSSVTSVLPFSAAKRTTAAQRGAGMPRSRQPLTTEGNCESAPATSPVPPKASMMEFQSVIAGTIVRKTRTSQAFATCETTKSPDSRTIRPMDTDLEVANRLAALREKLEVDQATFAKELGIEKNTYNAYERGKRPLTIETAKRIRRRYGISVDWLLFGDIGQPNHQFILSIESPAEAPKRQPARKKRAAA